MKSLKIGIVGAGNMGYAYAMCIYQGEVENLALTCFCDSCPQKRVKLKKEFPHIPVFASHKELIDSGLADSVLIATPHKFHPQIAIESFQAGLHVLTEKPSGVSVSEVRKMNEAAKKSGLTFGIMFNQRTNPLYQKAREIVKSGQLGSPKRFVWVITNWYRTQSYYGSGSWRATWDGEGGGVLLNQAPHNLDIWQWIFGVPDRIRAFCAYGKYHNIQTEDDATIYAEYENGAVATFITSTGECPGTNRLEISGDLGKIVLEEGRLRWWRLSEPEREFCFTREEGFYEPKMEYDELSPEKEETGHKGILQNFTNAVLFGEPLLAPGIEGLQELLISNAAYLSS